jgi:threonine dehydrogenase-like Zn-dependent dehydrogenase
MVKELSVSAAIIYSRPEFEQAIAWLAQRPELADTVITHRFSLEDAPKAFETAAARGDTGAIKVMVLPSKRQRAQSAFLICTSSGSSS